MTEAVIVSGVRTAIGNYGGALQDVPAVKLGSIVIKEALKKGASPRHVPAVILEVPDVPYTFSMKKVESAVTNIVNGRPVLNRDALINPESLDYYEQILPELQD